MAGADGTVARLGDETGAGTSGEVFELLAADVPFYSDVTLDRIGGMGVRWPEVSPRAGSGPPAHSSTRREDFAECVGGRAG